jgi:triosephosphate isomerase
LRVGRGFFVVGNWKMNGRIAAARSLAAAIRAGAGQAGATLVVCPPAPLLGTIGVELAGGPVLLGGQDCHARESGAFTGDVAAEMLADIGCRFVIVGHSERRMLHRESDADVRAKAEAARRAGLRAILCIGETLAERDAGQTRAVLAAQLRGSWPDGATPGQIVVAYEPVWAIGTGRNATPAQADEAHGWIRAEIDALSGAGRDFSILYGGSVKPDNAAALFALDQVDGALVGGASLDAGQFLAIAACAAARRSSVRCPAPIPYILLMPIASWAILRPVSRRVFHD